MSSAIQIINQMENEVTEVHVDEWTDKCIKLIQTNITNKIRENPEFLKEFMRDIDVDDWKNPEWFWENNDGMIFMDMDGKTYSLRFWCESRVIVENEYKEIPFAYYFKKEMELYQRVDEANVSCLDCEPKVCLDMIKSALETYLTENK